MSSNAASFARTALTGDACGPEASMAQSKISMPSLPGINGTASIGSTD
jgi:hypothetical protein